ncbi:alpha/beta fold hydrolase [Sphaerisporangium aureirubrum]|uniref:Alpha/beta fold hydrolase n=1 Tax=Sphaerisporangium aureirubrum TaxID=1544736 RepID=A0ABW1N7F9_9ACTN
MVTTGTLQVPGARIYYETRGSGPVLLMLQGGEGDARRTGDLVRRLAVHYMVITYDRRGLSRSTLDDPLPGAPRSLVVPTMTTHADDACHLLSALAGEPARVFGSSMGGLVGLVLAVRHPRWVRLLVTHEPPAIGLLPAAGRAGAEEMLDGLQRTYREEGWVAAFKQLAEITGAATEDREPDAELPPPLSRERVANFHYFFTYDVPAIRCCELDDETLSATPVPIVAAVGGGTSARFFDRACVDRLAEALGTEALEFPGGHNGPITHPRAFAERLLEVLSRPCHGGGSEMLR